MDPRQKRLIERIRRAAGLFPTRRAWCKAHGVDEAQLSRILAGKQTPGRSVAHAIERGSGVRAEEWDDLEVAP